MLHMTIHNVRSLRVESETKGHKKNPKLLYDGCIDWKQKDGKNDQTDYDKQTVKGSSVLTLSYGVS